VVIAASNEAALIDACLDALLAQDAAAGVVAVTVAANACTDATEALVAARIPDFAARGWRLTCLHIATAGKINALNRADDAVDGDGAGPRAYLDADVICDPALLGQLRAALAPHRALYATGTLAVAPARTWATRRYARLWTRLPFVRGGAVGAGLFAVNAAGRARWGAFPDIISDDTYARLQFAPAERIEVPARYHWPMVEGFANLVRVRRRQDEGVRQIAERWPHLIANEGKAAVGPGGAARLAAGTPVAFAVYAAVHAAVRLRRGGGEWTRGR
jgi:glycosyltransferase involved in cell wall biosynthesis